MIRSLLGLLDIKGVPLPVFPEILLEMFARK